MAKMVASSASLKLKTFFITINLVILLFSVCLAEDRGLYLVMMEGDPVAFLGASHPSHKYKRIDPNR